MPDNPVRNVKGAPLFDTVAETQIINGLNQSRKFIDRHFALIQAQDFYYKYREDERYLNKCIEFCLKDIDMLEKLQQEYISEQIKRINDLAKYHGGLNSDDRNEIKMLNRYGFKGNIPAFKRLCIIYEEKKDYATALKYCDMAIEYYQKRGLNTLVDEFINRKSKLVEKI